MLDFIFTVFRVIESFMDRTMKEQRLRTKSVNAKKVNTAKTQADRSCKNCLIKFSHVQSRPSPACGRVYNLLESEFLVIIVKNGVVH
jgi:azurin